MENDRKSFEFKTRFPERRSDLTLRDMKRSPALPMDPRSYTAHRQPPESRGNYVFEDGRAAYFYDRIQHFHGPESREKQLEHMLYSASKYACRLTGPGITDDMQVWLK